MSRPASSTSAAARAVVESALAASGLEWERTGEASYVVVLPGAHKLTTRCNLLVGDHALRIEAFVMRQPDENREQLWAWLLRRNSRMYGVAFSIDGHGDVYLVGRTPVPAVTAEEIDRLLGAVLSYADESFDSMLEIGFGSAIRREWAWRVARGEPLASLQAFAHFAAPTSSTSDGPSGGAQSRTT